MQESVINLCKLNVGDTGYIVNVAGNLKIRTRLLELGFTKGTLVRILNISSLKKSFLLEIRGYILALRNSAVKLIDVTPAREKK